MQISIIIPTFNRVEILKLTIDSFLEQSLDKDSYEIIISNNNSTDSTEELVKRYIQEHPNRIKYFKEQRQGSHFARNSAAKIATGEILYFTDDDMIADNNLLSEIIKVFEFDQKVASVTGRVLPKWEVDPPDWIIKLCFNGLLSLNDPPEDFIISKNDCNVFSCHQAILKAVFFESGGFNPDIIDNEWIGDNETGLNIKIKELGYKFGYTGTSVIYHLIPPQRITQSYLNKRLANQGNCDSYTDFRRYHYSNFSLLKNTIKYSFKIGLSSLKSFIYIIQGKIRWHMQYAYIFYYLNRIKYDCRLIIDQSWKDLVLKDNWLLE